MSYVRIYTLLKTKTKHHSTASAFLISFLGGENPSLIPGLSVW